MSLQQVDRFLTDSHCINCLSIWGVGRKRRWEKATSRIIGQHGNLMTLCTWILWSQLIDPATLRVPIPVASPLRFIKKFSIICREHIVIYNTNTLSRVTSNERARNEKDGEKKAFCIFGGNGWVLAIGFMFSISGDCFQTWQTTTTLSSAVYGRYSPSSTVNKRDGRNQKEKYW